MEAMALIEIDASPSYKIVFFHGELLVITRWYHLSFFRRLSIVKSFRGLAIYIYNYILYPIGSMVLLYMVTWIPSIYLLYVSIYTSTMDPSWVCTIKYGSAIWWTPYRLLTMCGSPPQGRHCRIWLARSSWLVPKGTMPSCERPRPIGPCNEERVGTRYSREVLGEFHVNSMV